MDKGTYFGIFILTVLGLQRTGCVEVTALNELCNVNPCGEGICYPGENIDYVCICPPHRTGRNCTEDSGVPPCDACAWPSSGSACDSNPCVGEDSVCVNVFDSFICRCPLNTGGPNCQERTICLDCQSFGFAYTECAVMDPLAQFLVTRNVYLNRKYSSSSCNQGDKWDNLPAVPGQGPSIWANQGCRAQFCFDVGLDGCRDNPCPDGSTCVNQVTGYTCLSPSTTTTTTTTQETTQTTTIQSATAGTTYPPGDYPSDCGEQTTNGVVTIQPLGFAPFDVKCRLDGDNIAWTTIQYREADVQSFVNRSFEEYGNGFGSLTAEHWLGNQHLYQLTNSAGGEYRLRVEVKLSSGQWKRADYSAFRVSDVTDNFRLTLGSFLGGDAGDALQATTAYSMANGRPFTTVDRDNDNSESYNCALLYATGGWWHDRCSRAWLNGNINSSGRQTLYRNGLAWEPLAGIVEDDNGDCFCPDGGCIGVVGSRMMITRSSPA